MMPRHVEDYITHLVYSDRPYFKVLFANQDYGAQRQTCYLSQSNLTSLPSMGRLCARLFSSKS